MRPYAPLTVMVHHSPARWLAPLALVASLMAVAAVIGQGLRPERPASSGSAVSGASSQTRTVADGDGGTGERRSRRRRTYRVRAGDTLTGISARTGVPLARLKRLNPRLDLDALQTGQRIKLSP